MRRICRAADIIPEPDPRLYFPDCPGSFLKPGTGIRDCPGLFFLNPVPVSEIVPVFLKPVSVSEIVLAFFKTGTILQLRGLFALA
jgi:hypothetical protein